MSRSFQQTSALIFRGVQMGQIMQKVRQFFADETGGEVIEYALILGLVLVTAIAVIGAVGTRVVARWTSVNSSM